jgi:hypothetical protein
VRCSRRRCRASACYARAYARAPAPALIELLQAGVILALLARKRRSARALRIRFVVSLARRRCAALRRVLIGRARLGLGRARLMHTMQYHRPTQHPPKSAHQRSTGGLGWQVEVRRSPRAAAPREQQQQRRQRTFARSASCSCGTPSAPAASAAAALSISRATAKLRVSASVHRAARSSTVKPAPAAPTAAAARSAASGGAASMVAAGQEASVEGAAAASTGRMWRPMRVASACRRRARSSKAQSRRSDRTASRISCAGLN